MWLKTLLPERVPHARILTYGYDAYTRDREQLTNQTIHDHAETLTAKLVQYRKETDVRRPIAAILKTIITLFEPRPRIDPSYSSPIVSEVSS